jgi:16S rRNA (guanine966-N2)-methyltransferase
MIITAGIYKGRKVIAPDENIVRPTLSKIRESIFNVLFSIMDFKDKEFLDVFAGSGIMGIEALSRGFKSALELEKHPKVIRFLKDNYKKMNLEPNLIAGDSLKILSRLDKKFDVIYIDPPYLSGIYEETLKKIQENKLLKDNGIIVLEHITDINWKYFCFNTELHSKHNRFDVIGLENPTYFSDSSQTLNATRYKLIKQKKYSKKIITFLSASK